MKKYANGIFLSKLLYGAELWGGAPQYLKKKVQTLLLEAARIVLGKRVSDRCSQSYLLKQMNWLSLEQILAVSSNRLTHSIVHKQKPAILAHKMRNSWKKGDIITRLSGPYKLGPRPNTIGRTSLTKNHYRAKAYDYWADIPEIVQKISTPHLFKKWVKRSIKNKKDLPPPPPTDQKK